MIAADTKTFSLTIGPVSNEYVLVKTTCPKAYDYGYTIEIHDAIRGERFVLVLTDKLEYQMGRYLSGGYAAVEDYSDSVEEWIVETLYARLKG